MNKRMNVLDYYNTFSGALSDVNSLLNDSAEIYKSISGLEYPEAPEVKDANDVYRLHSVFTLRNDISNAASSLKNSLDFLASTLGIKFEDFADKECDLPFDEIEIEVVDEETKYSTKYVYENLLDSYTYFYDLLETLDRLTGIRYKEFLASTLGESRERRLMSLVYDINSKPGGDKYLATFASLNFDIVCAFTRLEKLLNLFDELYDFKEGSAVKAIGSYKTVYLPKIEGKYLKFTHHKNKEA